MQTKSQTKSKNSQTTGNKEQKKNIQRKHLLLKNTVCVRKTQSCLIAVHLKESCQVFVSPLRKRVKMSPMDLSQRLTSSELFH